MHVHILGICGTFMAGIAVLARELGFKVSGSDENVYPPMSTQLEAQGIELIQGYDPAQLDPAPDMVVIGNAMKRGNPAVEYVLERGLPYTSGPQWLAEHVLQGRWVLAVSGTHGKTTTSSILAWILEYAQLKPGFMIGGIPENFQVSARLGNMPFFVIEADEYDSAFFDKRSKFIHYRPRTLVLNNLEFDHADIFDSLQDIQKQFHHLVRTVPANGLLVQPITDGNLQQVIDRGCWTPIEYTHVGTMEQSTNDKPLWQAKNISQAGNCFDVYCGADIKGTVNWSLMGMHNVQNALAAIVAARHAGVPIEHAIAALTDFKSVKRRMEVKGQVRGITVYDDFAHHPTAIASTVAGLREKVGKDKIYAVVDFASYTMRTGHHQQTMANALQQADVVLLKQAKKADWSLTPIISALNQPAKGYEEIDDIITDLSNQAQTGDHILIMSNGGFDGIHDKLLHQLSS